MPRAAAAPRVSTRDRDDKYYSKVIGRALEILAVLREHGSPLALGELTRRVGLAKSSVFRLLHTLEVSGYIERTPGVPRAIRVLPRGLAALPVANASERTAPRAMAS